MNSTTETARILANAAIIGDDLDLAREVIATIVPRTPNFQLDLQMLNGHVVTGVYVDLLDTSHSGISFSLQEQIEGNNTIAFTCTSAFGQSRETDIKITATDNVQSIIGKKIISFSHADYCYDAEAGTQKGVYELETEDGSVMTITVESFADITPALRANIGDFYDPKCIYYINSLAG